jgi:hypothetical protein
VVHYVDVQCANIVAAVTLTGFVQILLMSLQNSKSALVTPPNVMSTTATTATAIKTSTKETLKSKFVAIYESFFKGEDPSINSNSFWDEFFLLKVNFAYLESTISSLQEDELLKLKKMMNTLFSKCCATLKDENIFRVTHALETLAILLASILKKKFSNFGSDVITLICGIDHADAFFKQLIENVDTLMLTSDYAGIRETALKIFLTLATATDNINQNALLEYFMLFDLFESIVQIHNTQCSHAMLFNSIVLLSVLINFKKYESKNPYEKHFKTFTREKILKSLVNTMTTECRAIVQEYKHNFASFSSSSKEAGVVSKISGYLSAFLSSLSAQHTEQSNSSVCPMNTGAFLLSFYVFLSSNMKAIDAIFFEQEKSETDSDFSSLSSASPLDIGFIETVAAKRVAVASPLLVAFLSLFFFLIKDVKDTRNVNYVKLSLLILMILTEHSESNKLMHDERLAVHFEFSLLTKQKKYIPLENEKQPIAFVVIQLLNESIKSHMKKPFQLELLCKTLDVLHRILCFEKKFYARLKYRWKSLWNVLLQLVRVINKQNDWTKKNELFLLINKIVTILNMFITFGNNFLPNLTDYDDLYYELIRCREDLTKLYEIVSKYDEHGVVLPNMSNVKTIVDYFTTKLEHWAVNNPDKTMSYDQVMQVIRANYETLKLKLEDTLDKYEPFSENPKEVSFFRSAIRSVVNDFKSGPNMTLSPIQISSQPTVASHSNLSAAPVTITNIGNNNKPI